MQKILIIDDDQEDRMLMQKAVRKAGLDVEIHTAENGEQGLQMIDGLKPELVVILDTVMPGLNGFQTCKKIKELNENVKVIICTGAVDAVDAARARSAGADDYCVKTANCEPLIGAVKQLT